MIDWTKDFNKLWLIDCFPHSYAVGKFVLSDVFTINPENLPYRPTFAYFPQNRALPVNGTAWNVYRRCTTTSARPAATLI